MKTFLVIREQNGGCGHTIGCGVDFRTIEAGSMDEAIAMCKAEALDEEDNDRWLDPDYNEGVAYASIYEVVDTRDLPLPEWEAELLSRRAQEEQREREAEEIAEYERLKAKFG